MMNSNRVRKVRRKAIADDDLLHGDDGLQPERTVLSWTRTTMSFLVVSGAMLRWMPTQGTLTLFALTIALAAATFVVFTQRRRYLRGSRGLAVDLAVQAAAKGAMREHPAPAIAATGHTSRRYTAGITSILVLWGALSVMILTTIALVWMS